MTFSKMSITELRTLSSRMEGVCNFAEGLRDQFDAEPVIDLTAPLRLCVPLFPAEVTKGVSASILDAARAKWAAETERRVAEVTRQFAAETDALVQRMGGIAVPQVPDAVEAPAEPIPPLADAAAGGDCAGGDVAVATRAECSIESALATATMLKGLKKAPYVPPAPGQSGGAWTEAEDALIVASVVSRPDMTRNAVAKLVSDRIDRSPGAITMRIRDVLRDRIYAALMAAAPVAPAPVPAPKAPVVSAAPAVVQEVMRASAPAFPLGEVPLAQQKIRHALNKLGYAAPWTPGLDLALVEGISRGSKLPMVATDLGIDTEDAKWRFQALTTSIREGEQKFLPMDAQKNLLVELRARAAAAKAGVDA